MKQQVKILCCKSYLGEAIVLLAVWAKPPVQRSSLDFCIAIAKPTVCFNWPTAPVCY